MPKINVIIPTLNAAHLLENCLPPILASDLKPGVLVVDSSSNDATIATAKKFGVETIVIPKSQFNHGTTREYGRKCIKGDIIIMMTPDAILLDPSMLSKLVDPIIHGKASAAYGRQIHHDNASFFERYPREFNYPDQSHLRSLSDLEKYGTYTFFCSNSFAAYSNAALDAIDGFKPTLFGEDTIAIAKLLRAGHSIAYVAEAVVKHSHAYSLKQEFKRHFDMGHARHVHKNLLHAPKGDTSRGYNYLFGMIKQLTLGPFWLLPYGLLQTTTKWAGYKMGTKQHLLPIKLKKRFSTQPNYWNSVDKNFM